MRKKFVDKNENLGLRLTLAERKLILEDPIHIHDEIADPIQSTLTGFPVIGRYVFTSLEYLAEPETYRPIVPLTSWSYWRQGEPTLSPVGSSRSRMKLSDSLSGLVVRVLVTCRLFG